MTFKKHGPGCPCDCNAVTDCTGTCWFPCVGDTCAEVCGVIINIPTPDNVDVISEGTLEGDPPVVVDCVIIDPECPTSAPCLKCYDIFDRFFAFNKFVVEDCNNWSVPLGVGDLGGAGFCWDVDNFNCPNDAGLPEGALCLASELTIDDVSSTIANTFDGTCGTTTITIQYTVYLNECGIPATPAATTYTHVFENDYCTCSERFNNFVHVSTTATNNSRGITLDDPCNLQLATIKLTDECNRCSCFECNDYDGTMLLSITGPAFTGTVALDLQFYCTALGSFTVNCPDSTELFIELYVQCLECEGYNLTLLIKDNFVLGNTLASGTIESYTCGDELSFSMTFNENTCNLDEYTFSMP